MANKGRFMYVPPEFLEELEDIHIKLEIPRKADCMRIIAHNSKTARELKINLGFKANKLIKRKNG